MVAQDGERVPKQGGAPAQEERPEWEEALEQDGIMEQEPERWEGQRTPATFEDGRDTLC